MTDETAVEVYTEPAASELEQWGRDLTTAYAAAVKLVTTSFVPESYRDKPAEAAAAIMTGQEVGLAPLAALRSIDIIQGTPGMRAVAQRALLQSHGHSIWVHESTATRAIVRGRRKGDETVHESEWTIERARGLNLLGKPNWKNQPIAMLVARATSECARLTAADVLLGLAYSIEEIQDDAPLTDAAAEPAVKRPSTRAARKPLAEKAIALEPPLPADEVPDEPAMQEGTRSPEELAAVDLEDEARLEEARRRAEEEFAKDAPADEQPMLVEPPVEWDPPVGEESKP
jgi:hypothetical protein